MARRLKYRLWQQDDQWYVESPEWPSASFYGPTPNDAVAAMQLHIEEAELVERHLRGTCAENCRECVRKPETKGMLAKSQ
jgi:hypothetical protein